MKDYNFKCKDCGVIVTLGVEGDEPLTEGPPCCIACGSENILQVK